MGLISKIKEFGDDFAEANRILKMPGNELLELEDADLRELIDKRIDSETRRRKNDWILQHLNKAKRTFFIISSYDMEVNNGGLLQYFDNSSRETAPFLLGALKELGAVGHIELLKRFIRDNKIELNDLKFLEKYTDDESNWDVLDEFDDAFYELYETESLEELLVKYVREQIDDFQYRKGTG